MSTPTLSQPPIAEEAAPVESGARRLTLLYIFALSTVAALSLGAQWLVQRQLDNGDSDSRVINLAGRQRMLSQRIAKAAFGLRIADDADANRLRKELDATQAEWSTSHDGLQNGSSTLGLPGENSDAVRSLFSAIEPNFQAIASAASQLATRNEGADDDARDAIDTIRRNEGAFLTGMDAIVSQYVAEAEQRVTQLRRLELILLALTLLVLLAEGVLIFRPAVRRIDQTVARLRTVSDRLRRARDEAQHGNAAKTRFLANVSHELRTPMTAVLGMTEIARKTDDADERDGCLKIVEEAGESLLGLLNDLIDTAQIDAGQLIVEPAPFEPQALVERVARMMRLSADAKGVELVLLKPPQKLPPVVGDARRIEQVLVNLVGNGVKWTDEGSVTLGCEAVSLSADRAELRFRVEDTGVGIGRADQRRVFEPFTQLRREGGPRGGAGLGLAICQRIATAMDAHLELASTPGVGTTVALTGSFPVASTDEDMLTTLGPQSLPAGLNVLVIEDTKVNQLLVRRLLQSEGHHAKVVGTGEEAIESYRTQTFDLVLVDLQLPGIDGATTAEAFRKTDATQGRPSPPLVCLTAHAGPAAASVESCFDAMLTKPLRREELMGTLAQVLGAKPPAATGPDSVSSEEESLDRELTEAFLLVADDQLEQLHAAIEQGDMQQAAMLTHRFRGQIGYFDQEQVREKLAKLETACESQKLEMAQLLADEALPDLAAAITELKKRVPRVA